MDLLTPSGVAIHPVEVHLLCAFAEVDPPFPLDIPSAATSEEERAVLFHHAAATLIERDLADEQGPLGVAEEFVYLLRQCSGAVDLVVDREDEGRLAAVLLVSKDDGLLVIQDEADPYGVLRMHAAPVDEVVQRLSRLVPSAEAPRTAPFTIPRKSAAAVFQAMLDRMPEDEDSDREPRPMSPAELEQLLAQHGVDEAVLRRMEAALQPVLASGQAGTAKRSTTSGVASGK